MAHTFISKILHAQPNLCVSLRKIKNNISKLDIGVVRWGN